jgi:hypothetical protein
MVALQRNDKSGGDNRFFYAYILRIPTVLVAVSPLKKSQLLLMVDEILSCPCNADRRMRLNNRLQVKSRNFILFEIFNVHTWPYHNRSN